MHKPEVRLSQMVHGFGPGSLVDLPDDSIIMGGLEEWRYGEFKGRCVLTEERLRAKVMESLNRAQIPHSPNLYLQTPPPKSERPGQFTSNVTGWKFPLWFVVNHTTFVDGRRSRRLVNINDLESGDTYRIDGLRHKCVPIRVVAACPRGHISDVPWNAFVHRGPPCGAGQLSIEEEGSSGDISKIYVRCTCGAYRGLGDAAVMNTNPPVLGHCDGRRPWLGRGADERDCGQPLRLLTRSASNAYFPLIQSVISIPEAEDPLQAALAKHWSSLSYYETEADIRSFLRPPHVAADFPGREPAEILAAVQMKKAGRTPGQDLSVKAAEFNAFTTAIVERSSDSPDGDFFARKMDRAAWAGPLMECVEDVVLIHRLREVVAQYAFTRLEPIAPRSDGEASIGGLRPASLAVQVDWLPAIENRGEGIFIHFKPEPIREWLRRAEVLEREAELSAGLDRWKRERPSAERDFEGAAYYMLHSLSHMLITSLALDCGYPMSSLRERIYGGASMEGMYGILIYTGSSDAEGTLGGLIEAGRNIRMHLLRALESGKLCSNDPVCSHHEPATGGQELLGSACHGCQLIAETSCEQFNNLLDRTLVVPTLNKNRGAAFFRI